MQTYADKSQENKNKVVANTVSQKKNNNKSAFQFEDNRSEAITQRKLKEMMNNYTLSKNVVQLNSDESKKRKATTRMMIHNDRNAYRDRTADMVSTARFSETLRESDPSKDIAYLNQQKKLRAKKRKELISKIKNDGAKIKVVDSEFNDEGSTKSFKAEIIQHLIYLIETDLGLEFLNELYTSGKEITIQMGPRNATMAIPENILLRTIIPKRKELRDKINRLQVKITTLKDVKDRSDFLKNSEEELKTLTSEKEEIDKKYNDLASESDRLKKATKNGTKIGSVIEMNPHLRSYHEDKKSSEQPWMTERFKYGLYHELIHAYHKTKGDEKEGDHKKVKNTEWQVLGLGPFSSEQFSEGSIRRAMKKPQRPDYSGTTY